MADQCIVCLEPLDVEPSASPPAPTTEQQQPQPPLQDGRRDSSHERLAIEDAESLATSKHNKNGSELHVNHDHVAQIQACGHMLHDACLREWTDKANSCPICRQTFYVVNVFDKVGGQLLSTRRVEDKKQVPEFDPRAWADDAPEEPELPSSRCPVCNSSGNEEVLLLCDGCDAAYHTHCIDLDRVPSGPWFCMECVDAFGPDLVEPADDAAGRNGGALGQRYYFPRTQASMRRARQRARSDDWQGAWGRITGRIWDALELDLDYQDDEDSVVFEGLRRSRQLRERERQEHERWQQRLNIAARLGARDVFVNNIPEFVARPQPPQQSREERLAWGAFEKARDMESRKRKSRSATAEPNDEPHQEPERKLKRPRTRRLLPQNGESSTAATATAGDPGPSHRQEQAGSPPATTAEAPAPAPAAASAPAAAAPPSFLASLLKEVEQSAPYDAESLRNLYGTIPGDNDAPSRARSPSLHSQGSITPPPHRASSPQMTLSSYIMPRYPMPSYSPSRGSSPSSKNQTSRPSSPPALPREGQSSPETSDSEQRGRRERPVAGRHGALELRQPQPRRPRNHNHNNNNNTTSSSSTATTTTTATAANNNANTNNCTNNNNANVARAPRSQNTSPARSPLPLEMKESISRIVRSALKPHWRSSKLTAEQYEAINRDVSRKMYDEVVKFDSAAGAAELVGSGGSGGGSEDVRRGWERRVVREVERAVGLL